MSVCVDMWNGSLITPSLNHIFAIKSLSLELQVSGMKNNVMVIDPFIYNAHKINNYN